MAPVRSLALLVIALAVAGCGGPSATSTKVCKEAATRYVTCVGEVLGPEMAAMAASKQTEGVAQCARDDKTVALYRTCLPRPTCDAFMACLEEQVAESRPAIPAAAPRKEQCEQHVRDGLAGIAMQVIVLAEKPDAEKRKAQACVSDAPASYESCLDVADRAEVAKYGANRQRECEAWSPELAACVLHLPGAKDCKPDEEPLWRLPVEEGTAGPPVAWTIELQPPASSTEEPAFEWAPNGTLVVADAGGLRAVREGTEVWRVPATAIHEDPGFHIVRSRIVTRAPRAVRGLAVFDLATGASRGGALAGSSIDGFGRVGDRIVALSGDSVLSEIAPADCGGTRSCATTLGTLGEDVSLTYPVIGGTGDQIVLATTDVAVIVDRKAKQRFEIAFDSTRTDGVLLTPEGLTVVDGKGVALLSRAACVRQGAALYLPSTTHLAGGNANPDAQEGCDHCKPAARGCIVATQEVSMSSWVRPIPLPGGAVAFNDHGIVENTHLIGPSVRSWTVKTAGTGEVAGDEQHVYVISMGDDGQGPVRLLALARETGSTVWQTDLPGAATDLASYSAARVAIRDGLVAARVATKLFVLAVPPAP